MRVPRLSETHERRGHSDTCRARSRRSGVRSKTRHDEAFASDVEEPNEREREKKIANPVTAVMVHEQDADMNDDDKVKQSPTEEKSHVTVNRSGESADDANIDSKRQRLSSTTTHHSKQQEF